MVLHCDLRRSEQHPEHCKEASSTAGVCLGWDDGSAAPGAHHGALPRRLTHVKPRARVTPGSDWRGLRFQAEEKGKKSHRRDSRIRANAAGCVCDSLSATPPGPELGELPILQDHKGPPGTANRKAGRVPG